MRGSSAKFRSNGVVHNASKKKKTKKHDGLHELHVVEFPILLQLLGIATGRLHGKTCEQCHEGQVPPIELKTRCSGPNRGTASFPPPQHSAVKTKVPAALANRTVQVFANMCTSGWSLPHQTRGRRETSYCQTLVKKIPALDCTWTRQYREHPALPHVVQGVVRKQNAETSREIGLCSPRAKVS